MTRKFDVVDELRGMATAVVDVDGIGIDRPETMEATRKRIARTRSIPGAPVNTFLLTDEEAAIYAVAARLWVDGGCQRIRLSESLAAMFRLTSAPDIDTENIPHQGLLVEVPGQFYPLTLGDDVRTSSGAVAPTHTAYVMFASTRTAGCLFVMRHDSYPFGYIGFIEGEKGAINFDHVETFERRWHPRIAGRFAQNTIALLNSQPECFTPSDQGYWRAPRRSSGTPSASDCQ